MDRVRLKNSSNIAEAGYDGAAMVLEVMFSDGRIYHYFDVPKHVAEGLFNPPGGSVGSYFHAKISRFYDYIRF